MYYWKFKSALESAYLEKIVVWTEVKAALEIARKMSPKFITIERPLNECREPEWVNGKSIYSNIHRRRWGYGQGEKEAEKLIGFMPTIMIQLDPSSPLETRKDIDKLIDTYFKTKIPVICSAIRIPHGIYFKNGHSVYTGFTPVTRRQDMTLLSYTPTGSRLYKVPRDLERDKMKLVEVSFESSINVHNKEDLELAEYYMQKRLDKEN